MTDFSKNERGPEVYEDEVDLSFMIAVLFKNLKFIFGFAFLIAGFVAAVNVFYLSPEYESRGVIMGANGSGGGLSSLATAFSSKGGFNDLFKIGGEASELTRYVEILKSRELATRVALNPYVLNYLTKGEGLPEEGTYEYRKAVYSLSSSVKSSSTISSEEGVLKIGFRHTDPEFAYEVANLIIQELEASIGSSVSSKAKATELFVKKRMEEARATLDKIEKDFLTLQKQKGVIELSSQSQMSLNSAAELRAQLIKKEMEIELYRDILKDSGQIQKLEEERDQLQAQINKLYQGDKNSKASKGGKELFTPLNDIPMLEIQFGAAERVYMTQVELVELLQRQYELSRIETKKQEDVFQVIDSPIIPIYPIAPNKKLNTIIGFVLGFLLSATFVLFLNHFQGIALPRFLSSIVTIIATPKRPRRYEIGKENSGHERFSQPYH